MKEIWKPIPGYENFYKISNLGRVKSLKRKVFYNDHRLYRINPEKLKKLTIHNKKYYKVTLTDKNLIAKQYCVHRLMAWAFLGIQKKGIEVRHINGDGLDNNINNLCYGKKSDNMRDAVQHKRFSMSDWHPNAKLSKEQILYIRNSELYYKDLALRFNVHPNTIHKIRRFAVRTNDF